MRALPYRTPAADAVLAGPWTVDGEAFDEVLQAGWDYESVFVVRRRVTIDTERVRRESGLDSDDELVLCSRYWSTGSLVRHAGAPASLPHRVERPIDVETSVEVRGADLSGNVVTETTLVLRRGTGDRPFIARRPGSVLWRSAEQHVAEGVRGLLPVSRTSFAEAGLPSGAWYVSAGSGGWDEPVMGQLIVLLNEDNPGVKAALDDELPPEASDVVWQALALDVVWTLLSMAVSDAEFDPNLPGEEHSKAALVRGLLEHWYARSGEDVGAAWTRFTYDLEHDPSRVRAVLQERLRFLKEVGR